MLGLVQAKRTAQYRRKLVDQGDEPEDPNIVGQHEASTGMVPYGVQARLGSQTLCKPRPRNRDYRHGHGPSRSSHATPFQLHFLTDHLKSTPLLGPNFFCRSSAPLGEIKAVSLHLASDSEKLQQAVCVVDNIRTFDKHEPHMNGLYDPHMGPSDLKHACATCLGSLHQCPKHNGAITFLRFKYNVCYMRSIYMLLNVECHNCAQIRIPPDHPAYLRAMQAVSPMAKLAALFEYCKKVTICGLGNENDQTGHTSHANAFQDPREFLQYLKRRREDPEHTPYRGCGALQRIYVINKKEPLNIRCFDRKPGVKRRTGKKGHGADDDADLIGLDDEHGSSRGRKGSAGMDDDEEDAEGDGEGEDQADEHEDEDDKDDDKDSDDGEADDADADEPDADLMVDTDMADADPAVIEEIAGEEEEADAADEEHALMNDDEDEVDKEADAEADADHQELSAILEKLDESVAQEEAAMLAAATSKASGSVNKNGEADGDEDEDEDEGMVVITEKPEGEAKGKAEGHSKSGKKSSKKEKPVATKAETKDKAKSKKHKKKHGEIGDASHTKPESIPSNPNAALESVLSSLSQSFVPIQWRHFETWLAQVGQVYGMSSTAATPLGPLGGTPGPGQAILIPFSCLATSRTRDIPEKLRKSMPDLDKQSEYMFTPNEAYGLFKQISPHDFEVLGFGIDSQPSSMCSRVMMIVPAAVQMKPGAAGGSDGQTPQHHARGDSDMVKNLRRILMENREVYSAYEQLLKGIRALNQCNDTVQAVRDLKEIHKKLLAHEEVLHMLVAAYVNRDASGIAMSTLGRNKVPASSVTDEFLGKYGIVRQGLNTKRTDNSARDTISPGELEQDVDEVGVPYYVLIKATKHEVVNPYNFILMQQLVNNGPFVYPGAKKLWSLHGEPVDLQFARAERKRLMPGMVIERHQLAGQRVVMNRQPTLHRPSMMGHRVKAIKSGLSFRLALAATTPYNADFDGDEMNLHVPQHLSSEIEVNELMSVDKSIVSQQDSCLIGAKQNAIIESFMMTDSRRTYTKTDLFNTVLRLRYNLRLRLAEGVPTALAEGLSEEQNNNSIPSLLRSLPLPATWMYDYKTKRFEPRWTGKQIISLCFPPGLFYRSGDLAQDDVWSNQYVLILDGQLVSGQLTGTHVKAKRGAIWQTIWTDLGSHMASKAISEHTRLTQMHIYRDGFSARADSLALSRPKQQRMAQAVKQGLKEHLQLALQLHKQNNEPLQVEQAPSPVQEQTSQQKSSVIPHAAPQAKPDGRLPKTPKTFAVRDTITAYEADAEPELMEHLDHLTAQLSKLVNEEHIKQRHHFRQSLNNAFANLVNSGTKGDGAHLAQMRALIGQVRVQGRRSRPVFGARPFPHFSPHCLQAWVFGFIARPYAVGQTSIETFVNSQHANEDMCQGSTVIANVGYMQRRFTKALEDEMLQYDQTIRSLRQISSFSFGEDGMDPSYLHKQIIPWLNWSKARLRQYFGMWSHVSHSLPTNLRYSGRGAQVRPASGEGHRTPVHLSANNEQQYVMQRLDRELERIMDWLDRLRQFRVTFDLTGPDLMQVNMPVDVKLPVVFADLLIKCKWLHLDRWSREYQDLFMIGSTHWLSQGLHSSSSQAGQNPHLYAQIWTTPLHEPAPPLLVLDLVEAIYLVCSTMVPVPCARVKFNTALFTYLSTRNVCVEHRLTLAQLLWVAHQIVVSFARALAHPGEMTGIAAAQNASEPTAQMTLNSFHISQQKDKEEQLSIARLEEITRNTPDIAQSILRIPLMPHLSHNKRAKVLMRRYLTHRMLVYFTSKVRIVPIVIESKEEQAADSATSTIASGMADGVANGIASEEAVQILEQEQVMVVDPEPQLATPRSRSRSGRNGSSSSTPRTSPKPSPRRRKGSHSGSPKRSRGKTSRAQAEEESAMPLDVPLVINSSQTSQSNHTKPEPTMAELAQSLYRVFHDDDSKYTKPSTGWSNRSKQGHPHDLYSTHLLELDLDKTRLLEHGLTIHDVVQVMAQRLKHSSHLHQWTASPMQSKTWRITLRLCCKSKEYLGFWNKSSVANLASQAGQSASQANQEVKGQASQASQEAKGQGSESGDLPRSAVLPGSALSPRSSTIVGQDAPRTTSSTTSSAIPSAADQLRRLYLDQEQVKHDLVLRHFESSLLSLTMLGNAKISALTIEDSQHWQYRSEESGESKGHAGGHAMQLQLVPCTILHMKGTDPCILTQMPGLDVSGLYTNNLHQVQRCLDIHAALLSTLREVKKIYQHNNQYVNDAFLRQIVNFMGRKGRLNAYTRTGFNEDPDLGFFKKMSFEKILQQITGAAQSGEIDPLDDEIASIMIGKMPPIGTRLPKAKSQVNELTVPQELLPWLHVVQRLNQAQLQRRLMPSLDHSNTATQDQQTDQVSAGHALLRSLDLAADIRVKPDYSSLNYTKSATSQASQASQATTGQATGHTGHAMGQANASKKTVTFATAQTTGQTGGQNGRNNKRTAQDSLLANPMRNDSHWMTRLQDLSAEIARVLTLPTVYNPRRYMPVMEVRVDANGLVPRLNSLQELLAQAKKKKPSSQSNSHNGGQVNNRAEGKPPVKQVRLDTLGFTTTTTATTAAMTTDTADTGSPNPGIIVGQEEPKDSFMDHTHLEH